MRKSCEIIACMDYVEEKCSNTEEYVNKDTGEPMCPKNSNAVPREQWIFGPGHIID